MLGNRSGILFVTLIMLTAPVTATGTTQDDLPLETDPTQQTPSTPLEPVDTTKLPFDEAILEQEQPAYPYYSWYTLTAELFDIAETYPGITTLYSAGTTNLGFDLWVLEIANHDDQDKKPLDEREVIYLDGGHHANEDLGVTMTMLWANFLTTEYATNKTAEWIVENRHTILVPLVNADGNHLNSRWNANLVDLNRNYPMGWGQVEGDQRGPHPLSEPESQAIYNVLETFQPDYVNSFHTGIELMLYPWGYTEELPPDEQTYRAICEAIGEPDPDFCGPVASTIYPAAGGTIETSYGHFGAISFSYELADEQFMPGSLEDPKDRMERYWNGLEHAFLNVEKYGANPTITSIEANGSPGEDATFTIEIENDGYGNLTNADVTLTLPGATQTTATTGPLSPNEDTTLTLTTTLDENANPNEATFELVYDKRIQASPTQETTVTVPLEVEDGSIQAHSSDDDDLATLDHEEATVPGPGLITIAAILLLALAPATRNNPQA